MDPTIATWCLVWVCQLVAFSCRPIGHKVILEHVTQEMYVQSLTYMELLKKHGNWLYTVQFSIELLKTKTHTICNNILLTKWPYFSHTVARNGPKSFFCFNIFVAWRSTFFSPPRNLRSWGRSFSRSYGSAEKGQAHVSRWSRWAQRAGSESTKCSLHSRPYSQCEKKSAIKSSFSLTRGCCTFVCGHKLVDNSPVDGFWKMLTTRWYRLHWTRWNGVVNGNAEIGRTRAVFIISFIMSA